MPILNDKFDLHFLAQTGAHQARMGLKFGKDLWQLFFQRGAARVFGEVDRIRIPRQRIAPLGLLQITPGDLGQSGVGIDQLQHA